MTCLSHCCQELCHCQVRIDATMEGFQQVPFVRSYAPACNSRQGYVWANGNDGEVIIVPVG